MNAKKLFPIIGIIILIYVLSTLDAKKIIDLFFSINPLYVFLSACSIIPIILFVNYEWQLILKKHKIHVSFWYSLKNIFIGYFYGFITPGGFGAYTRAIYLKDEAEQTLQKCVANILIFNTIDYLALLSLGVVGGFLLSSKIPNVFPIMLILFVFIILLVVFLIRKETGKVFFKRLLKSRLFNPYRGKWAAQIDALYEDIPSFKVLMFPFMIAIFGWIIWFSELYFISKLFNINILYFHFILIIAVANVMASIPISIYGLGTREISLIGLFSIFGVTRESVIAFSLFWFVIMWLVPSIIGAGITILEGKQNKTFKAKTMNL